MKISILILCLFIITFIFSSCISSGVKIVDIYPIPQLESDWIRNGEPLLFEGNNWYPIDEVENFLEEEMLLLGTYKEVQFFASKEDIRPFNRLYTKFAKHKFRVFEKHKGQ